MLRSPNVLPLAALAVVATLGACGSILIDDYRDSWAVVRGRVIEQTGGSVAGATIRVTPVHPAFAHGDTVISASDGSYLARVTAFGVSSFRADVRLQAADPSGAAFDTLVTGLYVAERGRGGKPDTLNLTLQLRP
jgi:hypothetical protein